MNLQDKTKKELLLELKELKQKYDSLQEYLMAESSKFNKEGYSAGTLPAISDSTEEFLAVKKLKESKFKYKKAFQESSDAITITERDGMYIEVNEGFTHLTGYTREDVIGKLSTELNIWAIREDLDKLVIGLKERGCVEKLETKFRCKDGSLITALISANIIVLNNEPHILAIAHDITERKMMEELILKSKQQFDNLVSNIPVGVYVLHSKPDNSFQLDYVSPKMAEMLDLSVACLISSGHAIFDTIHPDDLQGFKRLNQEGIEHKQPFDWKGRVVVKGITKWLHISSLPQELESGDILWNGLIVDITEQVLAEAEIERQNKELQKINVEKDKFFSIIAHDLRGPFNGFLGLTQILAEESNRFTMADIQKIAVKMSKSASNLYRLLNNLLEWSQLQQGAIHCQPELLHLRLVVEGTIDMINESAESKDIEIINDVSVGIEVEADPNMLQTVLRNLLSNALKFTPKGGKVNVSAKSFQNNSVEISVRDTGIGMSQILLDNLFRLDVRDSRKGTDNEPSTGLGLLLCNEFVEKLGGKLWVESKERNGSVFHFTVPGNVQ